MIFDKWSKLCFRRWKCSSAQKFLSTQHRGKNMEWKETLQLGPLLDISKFEADYLSLRYPLIEKLNETKIKKMIDTLNKLGLSKDVLIEQPMLFGMLPVTLEHRYRVLEECGIQNITGEHITSYLHIIKKKTITELKKSSIINPNLNIENKLASYMTQWPTSLTTLIQCDIERQTLYDLRLKIIQRYLELILDLSEEEFNRGLRTYPTIKHRPLRTVNETLTLLQAKIMMPLMKIKSNLYLVHANSDNLKQILYKFKSIGGIDIKEIIRMHPKLCISSYDNMMKIKEILQNYGISDEAQIRCFDIYTLSPETVRDRIEKARKTPEFQVFLNHPRFLKIIYYNKNATKRMLELYNTDKKCFTLNSLTSCLDHFKKFEKAPGDRLGKGKDLLYCLTMEFGGKYATSDIRKMIKRHQFWINTPLVHVKLIYKKLAVTFSTEDIYENCPILLYPLNGIKDMLQLLDFNNKAALCQLLPCFEHIDISNLSKSQILSLTLYLLEKKHYFSGNGVWTDEKQKVPNQL